MAAACTLSLTPSVLRWPRADKINACTLHLWTLHTYLRRCVANIKVGRRTWEKNTEWPAFECICTVAVFGNNGSQLFAVLTGWSVDVSDNPVSVSLTRYASCKSEVLKLAISICDLLASVLLHVFNFIKTGLEMPQLMLMFATSVFT